jgi:hypothetical protein
MQAKAQQYQNKVLKASLEREKSEENRMKNYISEYKSKVESDYLTQLAQRQAQQEMMNKTIGKQLEEKDHKNKLNSHIFTIENQTLKEKVEEIQNVNRQLQNERKKRQMLYKDMLNNQIEFKKRMSKQGNMTSVEKQLNKADLKAFKNNDKNVYSFIPGVNHTNFGTKSGFHKLQSNRSKIDDFERERIRRLEALGYNRGYVGAQGIMNTSMNNRNKHNKSISVIQTGQSFDKELAGDISRTFDSSNIQGHKKIKLKRLYGTPGRNGGDNDFKRSEYEDKRSNELINLL